VVNDPDVVRRRTLLTGTPTTGRLSTENDRYAGLIDFMPDRA
jgi:hypothetical protein